MTEIINFMTDYLEKDEGSINESTNLRNDLGLSSFDLMDLSCEMEEYFNIKIDSEKLGEITCVGDMKALME